MDPNLTVVIPTYNRLPQLRRSLSLLLPQLSQFSSECNLVIIDNCSAVPVKEAVEDLLVTFPEADVKIHRNPINIGGDANILRCFEVSEARWIWLLGDDDEPLADAVFQVLNCTRRHPDCIYINLSTTIHTRSHDVVTVGISDFVEKLDHFGNVLFISACVYRQHAVRTNMWLAYRYSYTCAAQIVIVLATVGENGQCCLSAARAVAYQPNTSGDNWSYLTLTIGLTLLLEWPMPFRTRRALYREMFRLLQAPDQYAAELASRAGNAEEFRSSRYTYEQLYSRVAPFESGFASIRLRWKRLIFKLPYPMSSRFFAWRKELRKSVKRLDAALPSPIFARLNRMRPKIRALQAVKASIPSSSPGAAKQLIDGSRDAGG